MIQDTASVPVSRRVCHVRWDVGLPGIIGVITPGMSALTWRVTSMYVYSLLIVRLWYTYSIVLQFSSLTANFSLHMNASLIFSPSFLITKALIKT